MENKMAKFSGLQITLHWLTLILIAVTYTAMEIHGWFPKGTIIYFTVKETHYNAGILIWLLMLVRLVLKRICKDPVIIPVPPHWQNIAAKVMHSALFILFLTLPFLGIFTMAYGGSTWSFLGITISPFVTPDHHIKIILKNIHETLANAGYFLIAFHAVAALFHHYIQKDNTLLRMMPDCTRTK